ncbi:DUF1624 domain-containing protein [Egibacter rhizosphaerae]|uniref:DUF1624 domain-containing protein n=1 Tax=Egibacter rhizosphaerae TaxID=1670831 RepID=A0A411YEC9_9ACTN|nr:DUF418 domain-containing protein [Egibacter rhizosphaerae]QBI19558.1 DUF1624 domain-containing protein [Egibacter rhizosphaerae]
MSLVPVRATGPVLTRPLGASSGDSARLRGIDVARALAVLGMLAVHVGPTNGSALATRLYALPHGRASVLFVVLAGVGVALLARSRRTSGAVARRRLAWRAALLLPAGLALQLLDHGAFVILAEYAVLFALAILLLDASDRQLLGAAGAVAALGPVAYFLGQSVAPATFERSGPVLADGPAAIAHALLATGAFPLLVWAAPFIFGMWLGRRAIGDRAVQRRLLLGGLAVGIGAWMVSVILVGLMGEPTGWGDPRMLLARGAHSQMPLWLWSSTGLAVAVLGGCLLAARAIDRVASPLVATGQFALTIYVGHLVALHLAPTLLTSDEVSGALALLGGFAAVAGTVAVLWRSVWRYGPLESLLHLPWLITPRAEPAPPNEPTTAEVRGNPHANPPRDARRVLR